MRVRYGIACLLSAVLVVVSSGGPASGDPFGGEPGGFETVADSKDHWYCFYNVPGADASRFHNAMAVLDSQTIMWDVYTSTCQNSTDVVYMINPNLDARGVAVCVRYVSGHTCDAHWVAVNPGRIADDPGTAGYSLSYNKTIGHETGHTAGLQHSSTTTSAMRSGPIPDLGAYNFLWGIYLPHGVDHINTYYS